MAPMDGGRDVELLRALADRIEQDDPGAFNNLGVLYFSKGLVADAVDAFLRALALDPRMRTAARNLELAAAAPGACDAQLAALDARLEAVPGDREAHRRRARLLRLIGRHPDAIAAYDALIADDPDDGDLLFERGLIEQRTGDLRRAQRWFERAVNAASDRTAPRLHLAEVLYHRGQNEQSLATLDALLALAPDTADAHLLRGFVLGDMGHHEAGLAAARQAATINPQLGALQSDLSIDAVIGVAASAARSVGTGDTRDTGIGSTPGMHTVLGVEAGGTLARYGLGLAFRQRGYFDEARREFTRAAEHGEDGRLIRHAVAELDLLAGRHAAACAAYDLLLAEHAEQPRHWNERGVALHQSGELQAAAESYRRALRGDPRYAIAYNNLGVALVHLGDLPAGREAFARAAELDASLVAARLNLARWHAWQRDPLSALSLLREVVAFHPAHADAWHEMGRVLQQLHRAEDARDALLRAIEHRPTHADARYALADVLQALGDEEGALRETQQALALAPVRRAARLIVAIDLQHECPEAVGAIDLLALGAGTPLVGAAVDDAFLADLLPEATAALPASHTPEERLAQADAYASRGVHGEALERYGALRDALDGGDDATRSDVWRRASIGEARSRCLLGRGAEALPVLRVLGTATPHDPEVLGLFAVAATDAAARGDGTGERARTAMLRLLRLEPPSAALMHFVGDAAARLADEPLALAFYRRALALDPSRPSPRVAIAGLLRQRGDLLAARLELVAALAVAPRLRLATLELARVHRDAGRGAEATVVLTGHLVREPADLEALLLLAECLVERDRDDDARVALARVLRHDPSHRGARFTEAVLLARRGYDREARARWEALCADGSDDHLTARARRALDAAHDAVHDAAHDAVPALLAAS